jgi:hypothetical protein
MSDPLPPSSKLGTRFYVGLAVLLAALGATAGAKCHCDAFPGAEGFGANATRRAAAVG